MQPGIHVSRNQVMIGVFSEEQLRASLGQGAINRSDYCWTEGMAEWKTIAEVYPHLLSPEPSRTTGTGDGQTPTLAAGGERFGAYLLDGLFMTLMTCGICAPFFATAIIATGEAYSEREADAYGAMFQFVAIFVGLIVTILYHGIQGNSSANATWGQRIMGFKMVDSRSGKAPSPGQIWMWAALRSLILSCCGCISWLFFISILHDPRKQSAFDKWADILMVKK